MQDKGLVDRLTLGLSARLSSSRHTALEGEAVQSGARAA